MPASSQARKKGVQSMPSRSSRSGQSLKLWTPGRCGGGALPVAIPGEGVGAGLGERGELALAAAGARLAHAPHNRRAVLSISGAVCVSETSEEATPTARLASRTWMTGPS